MEPASGIIKVKSEAGVEGKEGKKPNIMKRRREMRGERRRARECLPSESIRWLNERMIGFCLFVLFSSHNLLGDIKKFPEDLATLSPTIFFGVPRIFQRIYQKLMETVNSSNFIVAALFNKVPSIRNRERDPEERGWASDLLNWSRVVGIRWECQPFSECSLLSCLSLFFLLKSRVALTSLSFLFPALPSFVSAQAFAYQCDQIRQGFDLDEFYQKWVFHSVKKKLGMTQCRLVLSAAGESNDWTAEPESTAEQTQARNERLDIETEAESRAKNNKD